MKTLVLDNNKAIGVKFYGKFKKALSCNSFKEQLSGYIFILPGLFFFALFVVYPLIYSLILSLLTYHFNSNTYSWVGLGNYVDLFKDKVFIKSLINTFLFVLGVVPTTVISSMLFAVIIIDKTPRMQTLFRAIFYLPVVLSVVSVSLVWNNIYNSAYGVLNYFLNVLGGQSINWLGNPNTVIIALSIVILSFSMGQPIILNIAALGGIPITYYEAADLDGAGKWLKFWNITVPLLKPTTLYVFVTTTIGSFQIFAIINLMTYGGPNYSSSTVLYMVYKAAFSYNDFTGASTMGVILFICCAVFSIFQFKLLSDSVEY